MNQVIHFYLNQTLTNDLDMFGFNLNFIDSNNDVRENDVQNSSISNFENFIKNEQKLNFQEDIVVSQKNCDILNYGSKKENFSKIENDNGILIDRKMKENIQQKIRMKIFSKKPFKEKKKKLGRKIKSDECLGEHNKFSDDNVLRKIKSAVLNSTLIFINDNIKKKYPNLDINSLKEKQLLKLKQNETRKGKASYNKQLLNRTLKSIFSEDISSKYTRYSPKHNKESIEKLINENDETKRVFFNKLLNLTFIDCLNHFRGSAIFEELNGLKKFEKYFKELKVVNDKEMYEKVLKYCLFNYEKEIMNKKERNRIKRK